MTGSAIKIYVGVTDLDWFEFLSRRQDVYEVNGLAINTGPRHRTEDGHETLYRSRSVHERDGALRQAA
ncbi:hypothetical protein [Mesorhizobium sp. M0633]|uniref:hypothetical protein n=1 Tax=Mesorhizobium sp. M0633 TaxID=2956977 RepID=UPI00333C6FEC